MIPPANHPLRDLDVSGLYASAGNNLACATEAKTFVGIKLLYDKKIEDAKSDFLWAAENGMKEDWAYNLAISELRHLGNKELAGQALIPTPDEINRALVGYGQVESLWRSQQYTNVCDEFETAFAAYSVPSYCSLCYYVAACTCVGRGESAGQFGRLFLETFGWNRQESPAHVLYGYAGYRQTGDLADAKRLLNDGVERCELLIIKAIT